MNKISLSLPYPPSVNHYWRFARGHWYVSREGQTFRQIVALIVLKSSDLMRARMPLRGPVEMWLHVEPPDRRERDLDNVNKAIWDSLQSAGVYAKDSQISKYHVERLEVGGKGHVYVEVAAL